MSPNITKSASTGGDENVHVLLTFVICSDSGHTQASHWLTMMQPLLSLIVGGRNDGYMGDFLWRLGTAINFLADSLSALDALSQVELVVCDWGSESPLHTALALSPAGRTISRFVIVPPEIASAAQLDSPFPIPLVQNAAIRRCRGEFIAQTDSDILFRPDTLATLLGILSRKRAIGVDPRQALLVCSRRHIPYSIAECYPSTKELQRYIDTHGAMLPYEPLIPGFATPSGLALLHRSLWEASGAYDEKLIYWGWMEIDLYLRITQRYPWIDLDNHGVHLFHIEHYPHRSSGAQTRKMNPMEVPTSFSTGNSKWGFADTELAIASAPDSIHSPHYSSETWRAQELQSRGPSGITQELQSPALIEQALATLRTIQHHLTPTPELSQTLSMYETHLALNEPLRPSWDFRSALVWCATRLRPLQYLELDAGRTEASVQVASHYRPVSLVAVGDWNSREPRLIGRIERYAEALSKCTHHAGPVRYLSGPIAESLANLHQLLAYYPRFDLVTIGAIDNPQNAFTVIHQLPHLLALGAVALFGTTSDSATDVIHDTLTRTLPHFTILRGDKALMVCGIS